MPSLPSLLDDGRVNAWISWAFVGFLLVATGESLLDGAFLWAGVAATVAAIALLPAVIYRDPSVMPPWELLVLAVLPIAARSFGLATQIATYLAVAAVALLVAVELHAFSRTEMTPWFAVLFVVLTTMAVAGVWAIAQYFSDVYLGTSFLTDKTALMWELVVATLAGAGAGLLFELYFRRYRVVRKWSDTLPGGEST